MNFETSDDRRMLSDTLRRVLAQSYPMDHRNAVAYGEPFHDPAIWTELCDLGLLYALLGEAHGGMGGSGFDVAVVFEEIGRALCPEPVLAQFLALRLLATAGEDLEAALAGSIRYALALSESDETAPRPDHLATRAAPDGQGGWHLTGRKTVVYGAPCAHRILVLAEADDGTGPALYEVRAEAAEVRGYAMIDGGPAGEVMLEHSPARLVLAGAESAVADALDWGALALAAEALGAMEITLAALHDYLQTRQQFGQPIGAFQALQHRAVDLMIEVEQARSITILAADAAGGAEFPKRAAQAKHLVGQIARHVSEEAIQMHGGIGITWEYPVSHYAKRLVMIDHQLGDSDWHLERLMGMLNEG